MPGAGIPSLPTEPDFCVVSRRNDSLGSRWRWRLFGSLCVVSFAMALAFAALGAWLVVPYSILEMAVLYLAFRWFERHASDWERISVCGERVILERDSAGVYTRREFNRFWARVELETSGGLNRPPRLSLRVAAERESFGESLPAEERVAVANALRRALVMR